MGDCSTGDNHLEEGGVFGDSPYMNEDSVGLFLFPSLLETAPLSSFWEHGVGTEL